MKFDKAILVGLTLAAVQVFAGLKAYGNSYQVIPGPFDWGEAKIDAEARGGHLATITTAAEWQEIVGQIGLPIPFFDPSPGIHPNTIVGVWLGATDLETEGDWKWITGEPWSFTNWDPIWHEPSGGGIYGEEDYLAMYGGDGTWNDGTGSYLRFYAPIGYLLEKETTGVPDGGSTLVLLASAGGLLLLGRHRLTCPNQRDQ
jgi:hypothetical protein